MKKIFAAVWVILLCLALLVYSLGEGLPPGETPEPQSSTAPVTTAETTAPSEDPTEPSTTGEPEVALVSYFNREPLLQNAWETLAEEFSLQTGVKVTILSTLTERADNDAVPTLCCLSGAEAAQSDKLLSLADSVALANLSDPELTMTLDGNLCGIASHVEPFGILYNASLLARVGYTGQDIQSFSQLKAVVEFITANRETLGFDAFTGSADLPRLLGAVCEDGSAFWELYSANSTAGDLTGRGAVFTLGTARDLEEMSKNSNLQLGMMPLYTGAEGEETKGLDVFVTGYWCIRSDAREQDIRGALAFLNFLVSPRTDGTVPVDDLGILAPYRQAAYASSSAEQLFRSCIAAGKLCVPRQAPSPELLAALTAYTTDPTEENRQSVTAILNGTA